MLILVAHGSRDPGWRLPIEELAGTVGDRLAPETVRAAFMQFSGPTLPDVVEEGLASNEARIRILPLFMATAGHVDNDIRPMVDELRKNHPQATIELMTSVGEDPLFPELITDIARRPPSGGREDLHP